MVYDISCARFALASIMLKHAFSLFQGLQTEYMLSMSIARLTWKYYLRIFELIVIMAASFARSLGLVGL